MFPSNGLPVILLLRVTPLVFFSRPHFFACCYFPLLRAFLSEIDFDDRSPEHASPPRPFSFLIFYNLRLSSPTHECSFFHSPIYTFMSSPRSVGRNVFFFLPFPFQAVPAYPTQFLRRRCRHKFPPWGFLSWFSDSFAILPFLRRVDTIKNPTLFPGS